MEDATSQIPLDRIWDTVDEALSYRTLSATERYCFTRARTQRHGCISVCLVLTKIYIGQGFRKREASLCVFCIFLRFVLIVQLFPYDAKFSNRAHARQHSPSRNMANMSSPASD